MEFHVETLPQGTNLVLENIKQVPEIQNFYLSGGTALSLQLGHRESEDLDFFIKNSFNPQILLQKLLQYGKLEDVMTDEDTLNLFMNNVKLQFLHYPYDLLETFIPWNDIHLSSVIDIACTKLITKLQEKYKNIEYNLPHILKSLVYFNDAEEQPMPKMHIGLTWEQTKSFI